MAGYVIIDLEIIDEPLFGEFAAKIVDVVAAHGGKYLVRGGATEVSDGDWNPGRIVVMEFESVERAREFVNSPGYQEIIDIRARSSRGSVIIVEGV